MHSLLRQDLRQVDFAERGFRLRPARAVLERAGRAFLAGYNRALAGRHPGRLDHEFDEVAPGLRGFAFEGAGMAFTLLDLLTLSPGRRFRALLDGPGARYPHLVHVGAGWAYARLRLRPWWGMSKAPHPLFRWLAWDGYGFHQGFFRTDRTVTRRRTEVWLTTEQRAVRDQGLGRALWFRECADIDEVDRRIAGFPPARRGDLWSGVGLAATYAGGACRTELERLAANADGHRGHLAQGAAFACGARVRSGIIPAHTRMAAPVLTGACAEEAAGWTDTAMRALGRGPHTAAHYQRWRAGIRQLWARREATP